MRQIKKICSKCGKEILVEENEYCCPFCGEFFEEINNDKILQHQLELELNKEIQKIESKKSSRKKQANFLGWKRWLAAVAIATGCGMFLSLFNIGNDEKGTLVFMSIVIPLWLAVLLIGPIIPIVNHIRVEKKVKQEIEELKRKY